MPPGRMSLVEKPKNFKGTLKQLLTYIRPYYLRIVFIKIRYSNFILEKILIILNV